MSTSPSRTATGGQGSAAERGAAPETDGVLVRPISGQIYLMEEADLENFSGRSGQSLFGLVSRH